MSTSPTPGAGEFPQLHEAQDLDDLSGPDQAAEIISDLISNIEKHGLYSQESMLGFLGQAYYALKPQGGGCQYAEDVGMVEYRCAGKCQYALRAQAAEGGKGEAGWLPIESAPKDRAVLLRVPTTFNKWTRTLPLPGRWFGTHWAIYNADEALQRVEPTGWIELPAPGAGGCRDGEAA